MTMNVSELVPVATPSVETRYRRIRTAIPVPDSIERIKRLRAVEPRSMAGLPPIIWHQAEGFLNRTRGPAQERRAAVRRRSIDRDTCAGTPREDRRFRAV